MRKLLRLHAPAFFEFDKSRHQCGKGTARQAFVPYTCTSGREPLCVDDVGCQCGVEFRTAKCY
jgi:hypothetical protein